MWKFRKYFFWLFLLVHFCGLDGSEVKSNRLLSNLFGLLGHESCATSINDRNVTGQCYNEMECLLKGGLFAGYCGPPHVEGVCCVFSSPNCDKRVTQKISYFTNKNFPRNDLEPFQCQLSIKPLKNMCWIRFDFETFELSADGSGGSCIYESIGILNSPDGPGGRFCGYKSGFATISRVPQDKDLKLSVVVQGPSYRWNIKISQIECDQVASLPNMSNCGKPNINGVANGFQRNAKMEYVSKRKKKIKKRIKKSRIQRRSPNLIPWEEVARKKMRSETFFPSFTARNTFCKSKFRQEESTINGIPYNIRDKSILLKIIDGTETEVSEYPWMASLQLSGDHFCGGSLISNQWVVTAAHCLEFGNVRDFLSRLTISLSDHDLTEKSETRNIIRHVKEAIVYPIWHNVPANSGDFALLKLDKPVPFSQSVNPVCLPDNSDQSFISDVGTAVGWGVTEQGESSAVLREVELNIISNITCYENFKTLDIQIREDMICTFLGPFGTENVCSGDSGSPLMVLHKGRFVHVGLTSFTLADCSSPFPAVHSRTTFFLDWIKAALTPVQ